MLHSPNEPWHNRHLVQLPTTQMLGLENFTVHPITPPFTFMPVQIGGDGRYGLRALDGIGDDENLEPWVAAIKPKNGIRTVAMKVVALPNPFTGDDYFDCPDGCDCENDTWTASEGGPQGGLQFFGYGGFHGAWIPTKDAGAEGWHVYFKDLGDGERAAGFGHEILLDVVPVEEEGR